MQIFDFDLSSTVGRKSTPYADVSIVKKETWTEVSSPVHKDERVVDLEKATRKLEC